MKKWIIISVIFGIILILILVNVKRKKGIEVTTATISRGTITEEVSGSGKIYPVKEVNISANVAGEIIDLAVEEGDRVKEGQVLVRLDQERYKAALNQAESALQSAQAAWQLTKLDYERAKELFEKKLISEAEYQRARAQLEQAESQVRQAQAGVDEAKDALSKTVIRAPMDGVVIEKRKEKGEIALGSQFQADVILVIGDLNDIEARVEVNENDIPRVKIGNTAKVTVDAWPDSVFPGEVTRISYSPVIKGAGTQDEVTNYKVYIQLKKSLPYFRRGMSCTADIQTRTKTDVLRVPIQAVTVRNVKLENEGKTEEKPAEVVFVVNGDRVKQIPVKLGISDAEYYEVLEGLKEGDEVVTGPFRALSQLLRDGMNIRKPEKKKNNE